jgi:hypothetical protein
MEKLVENDITYFYLRHVVIVCSYHDQFTARKSCHKDARILNFIHDIWAELIVIVKNTEPWSWNIYIWYIAYLNSQVVIFKHRSCHIYDISSIKDSLKNKL